MFRKHGQWSFGGGVLNGDKGDASEEMGASLAFVDLEAGSVQSIFVGDAHRSAVYGATFAVKCWAPSIPGAWARAPATTTSAMKRRTA